MDLSASFVAEHVLRDARVVPSWAWWPGDGASMLRYQRVVRGEGHATALLERVVAANQGSGLLRVHLGNHYEIDGRELDALLQHSLATRFKRFYSARYRLAVSLSMLADQLDELWWPEACLPVRRGILEALEKVSDGASKADVKCLSQRSSGDDAPRAMLELACKQLKKAKAQMNIIRLMLVGAHAAERAAVLVGPAAPTERTPADPRLPLHGHRGHQRAAPVPGRRVQGDEGCTGPTRGRRRAGGEGTGRHHCPVQRRLPARGDRWSVGAAGPPRRAPPDSGGTERDRPAPPPRRPAAPERPDGAGEHRRGTGVAGAGSPTSPASRGTAPSPTWSSTRPWAPTSAVGKRRS